jgi:hypothetical protein
MSLSVRIGFGFKGEPHRNFFAICDAVQHVSELWCWNILEHCLLLENCLMRWQAGGKCLGIQIADACG